MRVTSKVDKAGRILIPKKLRKKIGLVEETVIGVEIVEDGLLIRPIYSKKEGSVAKAISKMNLPVRDWKEMEEEIERGI